jgi:hypothetical protein
MSLIGMHNELFVRYYLIIPCGSDVNNQATKMSEQPISNKAGVDSCFVSLGKSGVPVKDSPQPWVLNGWITTPHRHKQLVTKVHMPVDLAGSCEP